MPSASFPLRPSALRRTFLVGFLFVFATGRVGAAESEWRDTSGATFLGEPVEALGPLLLFRTGPTSAKTLPMHLLSAADCVRFHRAVAGREDRAARWSEATGEAAREFVGALEWFYPWQGRLEKPVDFLSVPEPELLLVLFGGPALELRLDDLVPFMKRVERVYPGRMATVVFLRSFRGSAFGPPAYSRGLPSSHTWLVAPPGKQAAMKTTARFAPKGNGDGFSIVLMTRQGVPLLGGPLNDAREAMLFVDKASDLLWQLNSTNPRSARDRLHYLRAVRPVEFAWGKSPPLLLIDPFRVDVLRQRGVVQVEAQLAIGADGVVTAVELLPEAPLPALLTSAVADTLRRNAVFLPAIDHGRASAGSVRYSLNVPYVDSQLAADGAWVRGEARVDVPLKSWLVLKPIRVSEKVFVSVDRVGNDGTLLLKPVIAGRGSDGPPKAVESNAFNSDWFADAGAASVRPREGDHQEVDDGKLVWKRMAAVDGLVDLLGSAGYRSHDFCIGYAWTEFDAPEEADAWLGIGSDDGLRVWFNNDLVNDQWLTRRSRLDDDVVPVRLKKGRNQILLKVQNHTRDWSFTCRLRVRGV